MADSTKLPKMASGQQYGRLPLWSFPGATAMVGRSGSLDVNAAKNLPHWRLMHAMELRNRAVVLESGTAWLALKNIILGSVCSADVVTRTVPVIRTTEVEVFQFARGGPSSKTSMQIWAGSHQPLIRLIAKIITETMSPTNCKWSTPKEQAANQRTKTLDRKLAITSTSGFTGVRQNQEGKWQVRIMTNGTRHHLGCFDRIEDAVAAREKFKASLSG